ncbi:hypothetical protein DES40_2612 [Litorimonas taeanensis]|uniref:DUF4177 domain-containing protein n=1 Tax=Litorimonas taeanensis TaxID=568099 RepID=A0A420WFP9_9PROT|nr:DUF4177 domain-containing protein [Litorimonas taeanensis]RKQ69803.1 hypothetical protein DES40_2612 [Litorimonas taeanensis]
MKDEGEQTINVFDTRWEYKIIQPVMKGFSVFRQTPQRVRAHKVQALNEMGQEGWECYHVDTATTPQSFYMKRRLIGESHAR